MLCPLSYFKVDIVISVLLLYAMSSFVHILRMQINNSLIYFDVRLPNSTWPEVIAFFSVISTTYPGNTAGRFVNIAHQITESQNHKISELLSPSLSIHTQSSMEVLKKGAMLAICAQVGLKRNDRIPSCHRRYGRPVRGVDSLLGL